MFRIPTLDKWIVVLRSVSWYSPRCLLQLIALETSGSKLIDDIRRAREEDLSFYDAVGDVSTSLFTLLRIK